MPWSSIVMSTPPTWTGGGVVKPDAHQGAPDIAAPIIVVAHGIGLVVSKTVWWLPF